MKLIATYRVRILSHLKNTRRGWTPNLLIEFKDGEHGQNLTRDVPYRMTMTYDSLDWADGAVEGTWTIHELEPSIDE